MIEYVVWFMLTHLKETQIMFYHSCVPKMDMKVDMLQVTYFLIYGWLNLYFQSVQMLYIEDQIWEENNRIVQGCVSVWEDCGKVYHIPNV